MATLIRRAIGPGMGALAGWRAHLMALALLSGAILLIFARDASDMAVIWWTSSSFQHCLFIPFLLYWLVQQRAGELAQVEPVAWLPGLTWIGAGAFAWLIGDAAGVALFRHGGLIVMLQGAVIATLGPNVARGLAFPLFYALFLIPFGEELVPPLQTLTAHLAMPMLSWAGVPAHIEGVFITTPTGYFEVAEACSGARFVIAMAAYAVLVCHVCFRSVPRRAAFLFAAFALSVLSNGVRAFGTIYIAHRSSIDFAAGVDHVVYGWVFFAIVLIALMAGSWRFFDRRVDDAVVDPARLQGAVRMRGALERVAPVALLLAALAPAWSFSTASSTPDLPALSLPAVKGWTPTNALPAYPWRPRFAGADHFVQGRYVSESGGTIDLAIATYARQGEGRELVGFGQGAVDPDSDWAWSAAAPAPANGMGERIAAPGPVLRDVVSFYAVGGRITGAAGEVKLVTLRQRLTGGDPRAVAILISAEQSADHDAQAAITAFLQSLGDVKELADRSVGLD